MTFVYVSVSVQVSEVMIPESLGFQVRHEELVQFVFVFVLRPFWLFNSNCFSSNLHFAVIYTNAHRGTRFPRFVMSYHSMCYVPSLNMFLFLFHTGQL